MIALQVPGNFKEPAHVLLRDLAESPRFGGLLDDRLGPWPSSHDPVEYLEALGRAGLVPSAWETTYVQLLQGPDAVLGWMKGTALRPVLTALDPEQAEAFVEEHGSALRRTYPKRPGGTVLTYRRVFAIGRKGS
ncbi:MAG: hypothetical protein M0Z69_15500 [Actinomycetota bacterium]|nr:hypothetical protein [Actinomycetota bacterium]